MISYFLVILFTDTGVTQRYQFADKPSCEQVMPAVRQLYTGLKQPVVLTCTPKVSASAERADSVSYKQTVTTKHTYKVRTGYKF